MKAKKVLSLIIAFSLLAAVGICVAFSASAAESELPTVTDGKEIDVWLIAGQSNAIGQADNSNYPTDEAYASYKELLTNKADDVWFYGNKNDSFVPAGFGQGHTTSSSGPEIGLTTALSGKGKTSAIIKLAYGNTSLYNNTTSNESINYGTWTPPSYIEAHSVDTLGNRTGDLYLSFMKKVADGLSLLKASGYTPVIRGIYYMQGEADTFGSASSSAYNELLTTLISDMRADISEITGNDCSAVPFVYGRIYRNPDVAHSSPTNLAAVQSAQDAVAAKGIENVFMLDMRSDLLDPVSGAQTLPTQQDGWHFDSLTQQMIGEAVVKKVSSVEGEQTKYGFIPTEYTAASNYFAIFKKTDEKYVFDSVKTTVSTAITRAKDLTNASSGVTDDVVILLRGNYTGGDYPENVSDIGGTVTVDLNGYTLTGRTSLGNIGVDDCLGADGKAKKAIINFKNGTLLMRDFGIIFNTAGTTYSTDTEEKVLEYNFDNVYLGFCSGTTSVASNKGFDLLVSDRSSSTVKNVTFNLNLTNCTLDLATNAKSNARLGTLSTSNMTDASMSDYNISFKGCTFIASTESNLTVKASAAGDKVTFLKDADGSFGRVQLPAGTYSASYLGSDDGNDVTLKCKDTGATQNGYSVFDLVASSDAKTGYGSITSTYSDSKLYPFAVFYKSKTSASYTFLTGYKTWKSAITAASGKIKGSDGATEGDEAVILLRRDYDFSSAGADELFSNTTIIGGTLIIDLNGYSMTYNTSIMNTTSMDFTSGVGGDTYVKVKNGTLLSATKYGLVYNRTGDPSSYTVEKTYYFTFDNVKFGYTSASTATSLLIHSNGTNMSTSGSLATGEVFTYNNCTIDMTGAPSGAIAANLRASASYEKLNYSLYFKGCKFIADSVDQVAFTMNTSGDKVTFLKDSEGKYPTVLLAMNQSEPSTSYLFDGEGDDVVSYYESGKREGSYKVYELLSGIKTKYGFITFANAKQGFAVFSKNSDGSYDYVGGYGTWKNAFGAVAALMKADSATEDECVIYLTNDTSEGSYPENVSDVAGTVHIDLGGHTFTNTMTLFRTDVDDCMASGATEQKKLVINIENGNLVFLNFGLVFSTAGSGTYTTEKTFEFNIKDVNFSYAKGAESITENNKGVDLLVSDRSAPASANVNYNFNVTNCTFDLITNSRTGARLGNLNTTSSSDSGHSVYTIVFTDCKFITDNISKVTFAKSTAGDSFVMNANESGDYSVILTKNKEYSFYAVLYDGNDGEREVLLVPLYDGISGNYGKYVLTVTDGNLTESTPYATIPTDYVDTVSYPFALFYKTADGEYVFSKGYDTYKNAMTAAISLTKTSNASRTDEAVIYLRRDWSGGGYPSGTGDIATRVTIDLNGNELGILESLCNTATQNSLDPTGNIVKTNGVIDVKNGRLLVKTHGVIYMAKTGSYTAGYEKTFTFNFDNVYFGFVTGAGAPNLLGRVASEHTSARVTYNINYTNCVMDMVTNRPSRTDLLLGNLLGGSGDYTDIHVSFEGCEFIGKTENDLIFKMTSGKDTVTYTKSEDGNYASAKLPSTASAPTLSYAIGNTTAVFVKISDDGEYATYRLRPESLANVDFVPKMSLTLDRDLILNVYVPVKDFLNSFTLDGKAQSEYDVKTVTLDGGDYYRISIALSAKEAARNIELVSNLTVDTDSVTVRNNFGIIKYAEKILTDGTDVEKALVCDVLSYVRAAYAHFGTVDAEAIARIDEILGENYDENNAPAIEGSATAATSGLKSATFVLDGTPAMRFYLADGADASSYKFYICGVEVNTVSGTNSTGVYVDIDAYAYAVCETVTYTVNGTASGSFHIRAYYEWAKTQNDAELENLVARFWKYCQSARDYKASVVTE